jgi:hypothetical protein
VQLALDLVNGTNRQVQEHIEQRSSQSPRLLPSSDALVSMRRSQQHLEEREEQSPPSRQYPAQHGYSESHYPSIRSDEHRTHTYGTYMTSRSSGSVHIPPPSPMQAPQPMHTVTLPSPSSLNCPNPRSLSSISPPTTTSTHRSAQSALLKDLQHQVGVKTLEFALSSASMTTYYRSSSSRPQNALRSRRSSKSATPRSTV